MRRIAFINEKGGSCKTTLAVNTAAWLATARSARVLLCDLDTQGHAGKSICVDVRGLVVPVPAMTMNVSVRELICVEEACAHQVDDEADHRDGQSLGEAHVDGVQQAAERLERHRQREDAIVPGGK